MQLARSLPASLDARRIAWISAAFAAIAAAAILTLNWWAVIGHRTPDWNVLAGVPSRLANGTLYAPPDYNWRWSPVAAWLVVPIVSAGYAAFAIAHFAVLPLLGRKLAIIALVSWPFLADAFVSNTMTFSVVAGVLALRGSRAAALVYIALLILIPRPMLLPLVVWILWRDRTLWLPTAAVLAVVVLLIAASGYAADYAATLLEATSDVHNSWNFSPTRFVGYWWLIAGIPLAVWLTASGRHGLASLAISPYLLPQYFLVALWEVERR